MIVGEVCVGPSSWPLQYLDWGKRVNKQDWERIVNVPGNNSRDGGFPEAKRKEVLKW